MCYGLKRCLVIVGGVSKSSFSGSGSDHKHSVDTSTGAGCVASDKHQPDKMLAPNMKLEILYSIIEKQN